MIHEDVLAAQAARAGAEVHPRCWLVVGGAPRSGTTALGRALDRSAGIALFHEYASDTFFRAIDTLFAEERRHRGFPDFNPGDLMPVAGRDLAAIAGDVFQRVTGKRAPVIGTKFPGHQLWPAPRLPPGVALKQLMVIRSPLETVISSIEKAVRDEGRIGARYAADVAQHHWAHAWNHALLHAGEALLPVLIDRVAADPVGEAARIAAFLGIVDDLDLSEVRSDAHPREVAARYGRLGLDALHEELRAAWLPRPWPEQVARALERRTLHGPALHGNGIDFTIAGDSWKYAQHGLHPAETQGAWTAGGEALIVFRLPDPQPGDYRLTLGVGWAPRIGGETTRIDVVVDDQPVVEDLDLGEFLDQRRAFELAVRSFAPHPAGTCVRLRIRNPRSPRAFDEADDDRLLGCMLHSLAFERLLTAR